jgi:hypothetical protein
MNIINGCLEVNNFVVQGIAVAGRLCRRGGSGHFSIKEALVVGQLWGLGIGNRGIRRRPLLGFTPEIAVVP